MNLDEHIASLPSAQQWVIAYQMARAALPIWEAFAVDGELHYIDSVVGMSHTVAPDLLARALAAAEELVHMPERDMRAHAGGRMKEFQAEFLDPIVALQDMDWELPSPVQRCFYAVSNLVEVLSGQERSTFGEAMRYVVVNQALDAIHQARLLSDAEIHAILYQFGERA